MIILLKKIIIFFIVKIFSFYQNIPSVMYNLKILLNIPVEKIIKTSPVSGKVALVASFQKEASVLFDVLLKELRSRGFKILLVSNSKLTVKFNNWLIERVDILIVRDNIGRDFGSYKCGFLYLNSVGNLKKIKRLLLLNDTIIFPLLDTKYFWNKLFSIDSDLVGIYENFYPKRHLQSFFLLFNYSLINSNFLLSFWKKYQNWNSRKYAVFSGELGLTQYLLKNGFKVDSYINSLSVSEFLKKEKFLKKIKLFLYPLKSFTEINESLGFLIEKFNPSHFLMEFSFLIMKLPILKKDLVYKNSKNLTQILSILLKLKLKLLGKQ